MAGAAPMVTRHPVPKHITSDKSSRYDYCMVFKLEKDSNGQPTIYTDYCKFIVDRMNSAGLHTFSYLSNQNDEVIVLIRCPFEKMAEFADDLDHKLELNPEKLKEKLKAGLIVDGTYVIKPRKINDDITYSPYNPYNYIYGKYDCDFDQDLYLDIEEDPQSGDKHFTKQVRLKLLYYILQAPVRSGGCDFNITNLVFKKRITAFFPMHDRYVADAMAASTATWQLSPWRFPFNDFKNYFGEKIALHMVFLGHYSKWLIVPSVIGIVFQLVVWASGDYSSPVLPFFAVVITVWAVMMIEYWKREEKSTAMFWGMLDFEKEEPDRPEFQGDIIRSYINGGEMHFFPQSELSSRIAASTTVIGGLIMLLISVVASIYVLRFQLERTQSGTVASTITSIVNTVQITLFNMAYQYVAVRLTNAENHRTDTEYEDAMILKLFVFQFVNTYSSFFFLAFIAQYLQKSPGADDSVVGQCGASNCMQPLSTNLAIIFGTRIVMAYGMNVIMPYYQSKWKREAETHPGAVLTPPEEDYVLMNYNTMIEGISNYADSALQFGFSVLFVTAFPLSPFMSLISNYSKIKSIAWKLTKYFQRPVPIGAQDIGTWLPILQFIALVAVITNAGLVCFTMNDLEEYSPQGRAWIFIGFQWVLMALQFFIQAYVDDEPEEILIQERRAKFLVRKIIDKTPDENQISVEEYENAERQSLAKVATESVDKGCCAALFGTARKPKLYEDENFGRAPDVDIKVYPKGDSSSNNPMLKA